MSVDFPDPDGPIIATNSPCVMSKEIPCKTGVSTSPLTYVFLMSFNWISDGAILLTNGEDHIFSLLHPTENLNNPTVSTKSLFNRTLFIAIFGQNTNVRRSISFQHSSLWDRKNILHLFCLN